MRKYKFQKVPPQEANLMGLPELDQKMKQDDYDKKLKDDQNDKKIEQDDHDTMKVQNNVLNMMIRAQ